MQQKQTKNSRKINLGDCLSLLTDYHANGSYKLLKKNVKLLDKPDYAIMIRTTNFEKQDFKNDLKYISKNAYEFLKKSKVKPNDILMNKIANAGSVYLMPDLGKPVSLAMNLFLLRTNRNLTDQKYVYYYLKANEKYVKLFAIGTAAKTINKTSVRNLKIFLPDLKNQKKVSTILSSYDYLIENNNRRIEILEEIAQAIYKEWFVHFRFPGHEKVKMVDSELGKIPEKWKIYNLGKLANIIKENYEETYHKNLPLLDLSRIPKKSLIVNNYGVFDEIKASRIIFKEGDVLFGSIRPYFHKVIFAMKKGITNVSVLIIRANNESMFPYLFWYLFDENTIMWATKQSGGTKMPVISWKILKRKKIIFPDSEIIYKFNKKIFPFIEIIKILNKKNEILARSRNILLPKLISGEINVENLDIKTEDDIK